MNRKTSMNKKTITNRKAGIFAAGMVLAMVIFMATAWHAFSTTNKKINVGINILPNLTKYYNEQDKFFLYSKESAKFAASQAFYQLSKDAAIDKNKDYCRVEPQTNYFIWDKSCKPEISFIKQRFLEEYNKSLNNFIQKYPNEKMRPDYVNEFDEANDEIKSIALPIKLQSREKSTFAIYNFSHTIEASIKINLSQQHIYLEDFEKIYNKIIEERVKCQVINAACFKNLELEYWNIQLEEQGKYIIFKLKTKKPFFFQEDSNEKFAPIELNFIIEK